MVYFLDHAPSQGAGHSVQRGCNTLVEMLDRCAETVENLTSETIEQLSDALQKRKLELVQDTQSTLTPEVEDESHETLSDQILVLLLLLFVSNGISNIMRASCSCAKQSSRQDLVYHKARNLNVIPEHCIALVLGLFTSLLIMNPPFLVKKASWAQSFLRNEPHELLLMLQVVVLPPIVYESAVSVEKRGKIIHRLGTLVFSQLFIMMLLTVCFALLTQLFKLSLSNGMFMLVLALTLQLNDYSGTIEPHVCFTMRNENSLGYLGASQLVRNSILIYVLTLLMPDTRTTSSDPGYQLLFGLYQLLTPLFCCLLVFIPTTLVLKEGKYQTLSGSLSSNFDISITLMAPIFCYLICETLSSSGCQSLIICGLLQGIYGWKNLKDS